MNGSYFLVTKIFDRNEKFSLFDAGNVKFATKKTLTFHIKTLHTPERLCYPCPYCTNIFTNTWSVHRHLRKGIIISRNRNSYVWNMYVIYLKIFLYQKIHARFENDLHKKTPSVLNLLSLS